MSNYLNLYDFAMGIVHWLFADVIGGFFGWLGAHGIEGWLASPGVLNLLTLILVAIIVFAVGFILAVTMIWMELKILGRLMNMRSVSVGPLGYLTQIALGLKTFLKEIIIPRGVDVLVYNLAPVLFIGTSALLLATIPLSEGWYMSNSSLGLILTLAFFSIAPLAVLLAGWASNNKYTLIGGFRAAAQLISYEIPLLLSMTGVIVLAGSLNFGEIVAAQDQIWYIIPQFIGFIVFMVAIVAEVERVPFDLPEAESELVEGWGTEYGGMRFGLIMFSEYLRGFAGAAIAVILFLGGWSGPEFLPQEIWFIIKVFVIFFIFVWLRASLPRVRTDQILHIGWKSLLPLAIINLFIAVAFKTLGWF
jgi:NADH-quinone oxidoreductase subunit H